MQLRPENVGAGIGNSLAPSLMVGSGSDQEMSPPQKQEPSQDRNTASNGNNGRDVEMDDVQKNEQEENGEGSDFDSLFGDEDGEKDEDADTQPTSTNGGATNESDGKTADIKPAVLATNSDFPFGGPPAAKVAKPPPGKPTNPFNSKPNIQAKQGLPVLTPAVYRQFSDDVMLVSAIDGEVALHDRRISGNTLVGRLESSEKTPPWCMSVSTIALPHMCLAHPVSFSPALGLLLVRRPTSNRRET